MRLALLLLVTLFATHARAAGDDSPSSALPNADYDMGLTAIKAKDWKRAVNNMQAATNYEPNNADAWNWLGYSYRNAGDYKNAFTAYQRALAIDPQHRGAHEYLGEAYVLTGDKAKAQQHLAALERICGKGCDEYKDLAKALGAGN